MNNKIFKNSFGCELIIVLNLIFTAIIATAFSFFIVGNVFALISGVLVSIVWNIMIYIFSSRILIKINEAQKIDISKYTDIKNYISQECKTLCITEPTLYVIEDENINCISIGKRINHSRICLTSGALEALNVSEIKYLVSYELLKIYNGYTKYFTISVCTIGFVTLLSDLFFRSIINSIKKRGKESESFMRLVLTTFFLSFGPFFTMVAFAFKRSDFEVYIDNLVLDYTNDTTSAINTIIKVNNINKLNVCSSRACSNMFMFDPLIDQKISSNFSYHAHLKNRIENIKKRVQIN